MTFTLILTCWIAAGTVFMVPDGWQLQQAEAGGVALIRRGPVTIVYCDPSCLDARSKTFIRLVRSMRLGERVPMPTGCQEGVFSEQR